MYILFMLLLVCIASTRIKRSVLIKVDMAAYSMGYFKEDTHGVYMATSRDANTTTDINDGQPVMAGDTITEQKVIRNSYIYPSTEGTFFLTMIELQLIWQSKGYRRTQWERDGKAFGWVEQLRNCIDENQ